MPAQLGIKPGPCTGKIFLVNGGARGIGKAVVAELYAQGAKIHALARSSDNLKSLKEEFPAVNTICVDLDDWDETRKALENLEPVDCLVNNTPEYNLTSFWEITPDGFDMLYNRNLKAVVNVSQVVAAKMKNKGTGGAIVNVSSVAGRKPIPKVLAYGCLKAALEMLTKGMALELAPHKITVNSVCPTAVESEGVQQILEDTNEKELNEMIDLLKSMHSRTPTGSVFMPMSEVVNAILFFCSGATTQITGESLLIDGGVKISF